VVPEQLPHLLIGVLLLFFGRRFFWLFVGLVGYLVGFQFATQQLNIEPHWLAMLLAALFGVVAAVFAMFWQLVAAGIAGFGAGIYLSTALMGTGPPWIAIACGAVGALVAVAIFGWALVLLSSLVGAVAIVDSLSLESTVRLIVIVVLAAVGIAFQAAGMRRSTPSK